MRLFSRGVAVFLSLLTLNSQASVLADAANDHIKAKIESTLQWQVHAIADSPVRGLVQVSTENGLFYASADGTYFLQAKIYNLDEEMRNESEIALAEMRIEGLKQFENSYIEFKAKKEKYVVTVFTDTTCGYCRRLHEQMGEYNEAGITVRYLAYPRAGLSSPTYRQMVNVWCATDPKDAMSTAKAGQNVAPASCKTDIAKQYQFGRSIGVNGTPNIILPNGTVVPSYQPADQLLSTLQSTAG